MRGQADLLRVVALCATAGCALGYRLNSGVANLAEEVVEDAIPSFYHTTDRIVSELQAMQGDCPGMRVSQVRHGRATLPVVDFEGSSQATGGKKMRALFYFGEHARELISPEASLRFAQHMCGRVAATRDRVTAMMRRTNVRMYPIVNPGSRRSVERGDFCRRTNPRGVDLNRNWADHWSPSSRSAETNPGPEAFSEDETQALRDAAEAYRPHVFVTVHSGTLGMYTPWAWAPRAPSDNDENLAQLSMEQKQRFQRVNMTLSTRVSEMLELLYSLDPKFCNCEAGAAGTKLPYLSPGTSVDYMFDKLGVDYSFAFEIYDGNSKGGFRYVKDDEAFFVAGKDDQPAGTSRRRRHSCFLDDGDTVDGHNGHSHGASFVEMSSSQCFDQFNPKSREKYDAAVENWSTAFVELLSGLADVESKHGMFM